MMKILQAVFAVYYVVMAVICFTGTIPWTPVACGFVSLVAAIGFIKDLF